MTVQPQANEFPRLIKSLPGTENRPFLNWKGTAKWSNGLCSLCDDFNMFCYACSCWCCFRHELTSMMNEHWILWYLNCTPLMELRTKFRQQYGIRVRSSWLFSISTSIFLSRARSLKIVVCRHSVHCALVYKSPMKVVITVIESFVKNRVCARAFVPFLLLGE